VVERLPAYAPELNPVEGLWSCLKAVELANLTSPTLAEVIDQAHRGIQRVRRTPHLAYSFLCHTGLWPHDTSTQRPRSGKHPHQSAMNAPVITDEASPPALLSTHLIRGEACTTSGGCVGGRSSERQWPMSWVPASTSPLS
jgi:hypothetical protein